MKKSKIFMIISICILCLSLIGATVAYYTKTLFNETASTITHGLDYYINYENGQTISTTTLNPSEDYTGGAYSDIELWKKDNTYNIYGHIYLDITTMSDALSNSSAVKYTIVNNNDIIARGTVQNNNENTILMKGNIPLKTTEQLYRVYIWLDKNENLDSTLASSSLSLSVRCEATMIPEKVNLVQHINNLYTPNDTAENNGITYNLDTTHYLMNDRLGTDSVGANDGNIRYYGSSPNNYIDIGDLYEQDFVIGVTEEYINSGFNTHSECVTALENEVSSTFEVFGNINCKTDYENNGFSTQEDCEEEVSSILEDYQCDSFDDDCYNKIINLLRPELCGTEITVTAGTPKLYRIIGLFKDVKLSDGTKKDLVKVVRNEPIGSYSWDQSPSDINSGEGINEWSQADLMKLLNSYPGNETVGRSLYWNSGSGTCYGYDAASEEYKAIPCNFTNSGLNSNVHNKIEEVYWNLGGWNSNNVYPNQIYEYERGETVYQIGSNSAYNDTVTRKTVWPGKVALAYPSDYGYAVDLDSCSETLGNYSNCIGTNWMHNTIAKNEMYESWLLTPLSSLASIAWIVNNDGNVNNGNDVNHNNGVSPVFYLDSALGIVTGDGSIETPFVVR